MRALGLLLALVLTLAAARAQELYVINEDGRRLTLPCQQQDRVVVNGSWNSILLDGPCHTLVLNGDGNQVEARAPLQEVRLNGDGNRVRCPPPEPRLTDLGKGNQCSVR